MEALRNLLKRAASLQQDFAIQAMDKPSNLDLVVELNTQGQLYDKGIGSDGISLGSYRPFTIDKKIDSGQPTDRVTLKDTGDFYNSVRANFSYNGDIIITADTIKGDTDLEIEWGKNILGLTDESISIINPIFTDDIIKDVKAFL